MNDIAEEATTTADSGVTMHSVEKVTVTDSRGRVIAVRKLNALQVYRLTKAMGPSAASAGAMDLAVIASSVSKIDMMDFAFPSRERDVEFLIEKLDFAGLEAAGKGLQQLAEAADLGVEAAKN
jgi:hypothetical protein